MLDLLQKEIEDRINNQIWTLAQELYRNHIEPAKYEVILEKLKGKLPPLKLTTCILFKIYV